MRVQPDGVYFDFTGPGGHKVEWRLRLTWTSLLALHEQWGETYELRIEASWKQRALADLALVVESAGGPKAVDVVEASPPILELADAMQAAWNWVHRGYESAERFADALRKEHEEAEKEAVKARRKKVGALPFHLQLRYALEDALGAGLTHEQFWASSPFETRRHVQAAERVRRHAAISSAWHHIAIDNQTQKEKRLKALEEHIADDRFKGAARQQTPREMFDNFRRIAGGAQKRQKREAKEARAEAAAAEVAEKVEG